MPRTDRDEWDSRDDRPTRRETKPLAGTILAAAGFGLTLIVGGVIGFAAGRPAKEPEKAKPVDVAQNTTTPPPVVTPEPVKPPTPEPKPKVEPKTKQPEPKPKPPEPKPKPPEPKKVDPPEPKKVDPPTTVAVSFQKDVLPIFKGKCNLCHGDAGKPKGDIDLRTLATSLKGGDNGAGAKPGKLDESQIWKTIDDGTMPPAGKEKLTAAEIKTIRDWILSGAK